VTLVLETVDDYIEAGLTHQIHTSERMSRRGCRRRWSWIFQDMYYPHVTAKPLEFGVAYHKAMEVLYDPLNRPDGEVDTAYALARVAFKTKCQQQKAEFIAHNPNLYTSEVDEDYKERVELGLGMLDFWYTQIMPTYDHNFTPVKVEIPFEVPIYEPETDGERVLWCKCDQCWLRYCKWMWSNGLVGVMEIFDEARWQQERPLWKGLPVTYGGRVDMLAQDTNGDYWIVDWKTTVRMTNAEPNVADEFLLLDDQITSYCWAFWVLGVPVKGFIYVEIKKAYPQEPEPNKTTRLGRLFSVNKQQETSYEVYKRTVAENDSYAYQSGLYDEFLEYLKENANSEHFIHRHQIVRNETELRNAGENIYFEAQEMTSAHLVNFPSPGRFACNFCAFREPCVAKNRGEDFEYALDTMYEKRTRHYWETAESTTDKRYS